MDVISELREEVREIKRRQTEIVKLAKVTAVDVETSLLTIESEGLPQSEVPFFTSRAGEDQTYWLPSVGELGYLFPYR